MMNNQASGSARVGVVGVVHGDVNIYEAFENDDPERTLEVARNCLTGHMSRRAAELLKGLAESGNLTKREWRHLTGETAYYWAVAMLSDRSLESLEDDCLRDLRAARKLSLSGPVDGWCQALDVVVRLIEWQLEQERTGDRDENALEVVFVDFDTLPPPRRQEISRHLDLVLTGALQDRHDTRFADLVRGERTGQDREARFWKFFEPTPAEPRGLQVRSIKAEWSALAESCQMMAICGPFMVGTGLAFAVATMSETADLIGVLAGILLLSAFGLTCAFGPERMPHRYVPFPAWERVSRRAAFSRYIVGCVEEEFGKRAPEGESERAEWMLATQWQRMTLAHRIGYQYAEPEVAPKAIDWLIAWYARNAADEWKKNGGSAWRRYLAKAVLIAAGLLATVAELGLLTGMFYPEGSVEPFAAVMVTVGGLLSMGGRVDVLLVTWFHARRAKGTAERRSDDEKKAYEARVELLRDRPDDTEMARWLDYDKIYLKTLAMNQYGLTNRDVLAHAVLTEAAPGARRARVRKGPPRFSAYTVRVFLLTSSGVHRVDVHLDGPTGIAKDQNRTAFRYDALAAVYVTESGYRLDDGPRDPILPQPGVDGTRDRSPSTHYEKVRIALVSGHHVDITVENPAAFFPQGTSRAARTDAVAPPSGAGDLNAVLRLLEAVAADGRERIDQVKNRRGRRLRDTSGADGRRYEGDTESP